MGVHVSEIHPFTPACPRKAHSRQETCAERETGASIPFKLS